MNLLGFMREYQTPTVIAEVMQSTERCRCRQVRASHLGGRRPFDAWGATPRYAPDLPFLVEHTRLEVALDPEKKHVRGKVLHRLRRISDGATSITLNQVALKIKGVRVGRGDSEAGPDASAKYEVDGDRLSVELPQAATQWVSVALEIEFEADHPRRGIYFTGPDADYPDKPWQVWSQGQDEDHRHWFPCFDYPNQKATTEVIATVPAKYVAVSNGRLVNQGEAGNGKAQFHYSQEVPHVTYLICLSVAEFESWEEKGPRGLPLQYFVEKGRAADGKRGMGATPRMVAEFESKIGVPYPYAKYAQVVVQDFIFGGMENTSATTLTDRVLIDERAAKDHHYDSLIAHELAHQWFGDLLTCRDWSHGWLNEGFATFFERVWAEADVERFGSREKALEEARWISEQDWNDYLAEDGGRYRRPIVCNQYVEPIDLFDAHLYQKGGLVLNMIRGVLGESAFWKSVKLYVSRHSGKSVETLDLIRAIEETTGRNLRRLFDQWVFGSGYPELELSYSWDPEKKRAEISVEQKQASDGKGLFTLPALLEFELENGKVQRENVLVENQKDRFFFTFACKPTQVRFDPEGNLPKAMKFPRPKELLVRQLEKAEQCTGRIEAAKELSLMGAIPRAELVSTLKQALLNDGFWAVQNEVARILGKLGSVEARDALLEALNKLGKSPDSRPVRGVILALGSFRDDAKVAKALKPFAESHPSVFAEAEATKAWARVESSESERERFLISQLKKTAHEEVLRGAALEGLAGIRGAALGLRPQALDALMEWTERGKPLRARLSAVRALGDLAAKSIPSVRSQIFERLGILSAEDDFRLRTFLVASLGLAGGFEAVPILERIRELDADGRVKREVLATVAGIRDAGGAPEQVGKLKTDLEKMEKDYRELRGMVEELKAKAEARA